MRVRARVRIWVRIGVRVRVRRAVAAGPGSRLCPASPALPRGRLQCVVRRGRRAEAPGNAVVASLATTTLAASLATASSAAATLHAAEGPLHAEGCCDKLQRPPPQRLPRAPLHLVWVGVRVRGKGQGQAQAQAQAQTQAQAQGLGSL